VRREVRTYETLEMVIDSETYHLEAGVRGERKRISGIRLSEESQKVISVQW